MKFVSTCHSERSEESQILHPRYARVQNDTAFTEYLLLTRLGESLMKKVILILDDDELARRTLGVIFSQEDYEVLEVPNVPEAINTVRTKHIDLAIVDIKMPIVDGYRFCEFLRRTKKYSHIPIVILTGEEKRYGREEAQELEVEAFIEKPYDSHSLIRKVRQILSGS